jgi:predicted amidohydrolase YtcJ
VVHPADIPRFAELDVTANAQALWACNEPQMTELTIPYLGSERSAWQYPFGSILRAGGRVALGSDWPVSSPDPLEIMHVAVTRTEPYVRDSSPFLPSEAMTLDQALYAYTMGSAHTSHHEDVTGSIEIGKYADLVVLDHDLTTATTLTDASVEMTMIEGVPVYQAPSF